MKFKALIFSCMAAVLAIAACTKASDENTAPSSVASMTVSQDSLSFESTVGSKTVSVTSSRNWKVDSITVDWVSVSIDGEPAEGKVIAASSNAVNVQIAVLENTEHDRSTVITFNGGTIARKSIVVSQAGSQGEVIPGDGSKENPFSASEAHAVAMDLGDGGTSSVAYYVKGIVHKMGSKHEDGVTNYGNGSFYISDDGNSSSEDFYCYQVYYLGNKEFTSVDQVKVGDEVIVYGKITNYSGTAETTSKGTAYLYSLNGEVAEGGSTEPDPEEEVKEEGDGTVDSPFNATRAHNEALKLASGATSDKAYYIKGKVHKMGNKHEDGVTNYGNGSFYISDSGESSDYDFYCFQVMYLGNTSFTSVDQVKVGDEVIVYGKITNYNGTAETTSKGTAYIYSLNGETAGGSSEPDPEEEEVKEEGDGTLESPFNATRAHNKAVELGSGNTSDQEYYIKGIVHKLGNKFAEDIANYGDVCFYISDSGQASNYDFYCYQVYYLGGTKFTSTDQLKVGDEVIVYGKITNYQGTCETVGKGASYIYSINGETSAGPYLGVSSASIKVANTETTASFEITSNTEWTASVDNSNFTLSQTAGDGDVTINVTFPENTTFEEVKATVTITSEAGTKTVEITQAAAPDPNAKTVSLTNDDIKTALAGTGEGSDKYGDITFSSSAGNWEANANRKNTIEYLQLRNNQGSYIKSPKFNSNVEKVEVVINAKTIERTLYLVPTDTELPNTTSSNKYSSDGNESVIANAYGSASCERQKAQTITITVTGDTDQFMLIAYDGATYIDSITVYLK